MSPLTSANVHAGRTVWNTSPWARAASRQRVISVSRTRVRITLSSVPPSCSIAATMIASPRGDWDGMADAFAAIAEAGKVTPAEQVEAARAALLALKNAWNVEIRVVPDRNPEPKVIPDREQRQIHVLDVIVRLDPDEPDI